MRYMGSKRSIAKEYLPFLMQFRRPDQVWVEPFMGGCNSIDKVPGRRIGNDLHPQLVIMWKALQQGWQPPDEISEYEYYQLKKEQRMDALTAFAGFGCAFGGKYFESYARDDTGVNYAAQTKRTVLKQIAAMPADEVVFYHGSYDDFYIPPNSFIYCDPPYADTGAYRVDDFDHRRFWKWANRMVMAGHTVVVAEYTAPPDWTPAWQKKVNSRLSGVQVTASIEKIFVRASAYDEEAAREYYDPPLHKYYTIKQVLHFVGTAARKDTSHVLIEDLRATASNHVFTTSAPINIPHNVKPNAKALYSAIKTIDELHAEVHIDLTKAGKLSIKSDKFKVFIECLNDQDLVQAHKPQGVFVSNPKELFKGLQLLAPVMCENDLREYANGVAITKNSCMATDNVLFAEVWHGSNLSVEAIVGYETVTTVVNFGEEPERIQISPNTITFWYYGERYLTSTLIDVKFPSERIEALLNRPAQLVAVPNELFDAAKLMRKVTKDKVTAYIESEKIRSFEDDEETGSTFEVATGVKSPVRMDLDRLIKLDGLADQIDWGMYPNPLSFQGKGLRGVVASITR